MVLFAFTNVSQEAVKPILWGSASQPGKSLFSFRSAEFLASALGNWRQNGRGVLLVPECRGR